MENDEDFNHDTDVKKEDNIIITTKSSSSSTDGLDIILKNPKLQKNVRTLMNLIDRFDADSKHASELILEIARILDESKQCLRDQICRRIKEILRDKIREGKITPKWIEESLPKEYKREYNKSELSSLSKKNLEVQTNSGLALLDESSQDKDSTNGKTSKNNKPNELPEEK